MRADDPLPVAAADLATGMLVIDVVHTPESVESPTPLLAVAAARGYHTQNGRAMHLAQIGMMADFLLGPDAPAVPPARL